VIIFIAALRRELSGLQSRVQTSGRERLGRAWATRGSFNGRQVALVQSGIGRERSQEATRLAIQELRPEAIVSIGLSGGLAPGVRGGDLILGERLLAFDAAGASLGEPIAAEPSLYRECAKALEDEFIPVHLGDVASVPEVMPGPAEKQLLAAACDAKAVDMESYWVAREARAAGVPFAVMRAASDTLGETLPEYERFLNDMGDVRPLHAAWYFLTHPGGLVAAPGLAQNARRGERYLQAFGELFLTKIHRGALVQQ
jgi:nucleoside phosphorylase